jgi:hypothetical protein
MADDIKPDERGAETVKTLKSGDEKRRKPKRQRAVCSVSAAADVALYRHTSPLALYCAKHVPPR